MTRFLLELLSVGSRLLNVLTGGTADLTFSARSYIERLWVARVVDCLFFWADNHTEWAWFEEVRRSQRTLDLHEDRHP